MNNNSINTKIRGSRFFSHLLILGILFFLPEVLFSIGKPTMWLAYFRPAVYIMVFYINYYILVDKFLFDKNRKWLFFVINLLLVISIVYLFFFMGREFMPPMHDGPRGGEHGLHGNVRREMFGHHVAKMLSFLVRDGVILVLTIALAGALKFGEKWRKWEQLQKEVIAERQENELKNLKNQLNPHFLFNTLNNIYSLISISPVKAQKSVHDLSSLLRYVLYDNNEKKVPLAKDLKFVSDYIELMKLRLSPSVELSVNIQNTDLEGKEIAPLMFISIVENAFKHGILSSKTSFIKVQIKIEGDEIKCLVENSYYPKNDNDKSGSGIGLKNLECQLSILYPNNYEFKSEHKNGVYSTILNIKLS